MVATSFGIIAKHEVAMIELRKFEVPIRFGGRSWHRMPVSGELTASNNRSLRFFGGVCKFAHRQQHQFFNLSKSQVHHVTKIALWGPIVVGFVRFRNKR